MTPSERILFALDVPSLKAAQGYVSKLKGHVGGFKVGLELFMGAGHEVVEILTLNNLVMLDLKLYDIPETVERAVLVAGDLGVRFVTLHVQQGETLRRAVKAAERTGIQLLGVTVLTSMTHSDCADLRFKGFESGPPSERSLTDTEHPFVRMRATYLAKFAKEQGVTGFVCSAKDVAAIRAEVGAGCILVTPGIRPAGAATGDQKRVGTPAEAIREGADYLVVGRPIRDAEDPVKAADDIASEILV